jgi:YVTN family beta-propeller protein
MRLISPSSHDRVYTGDQTSNTVSVIDPGTNMLLGVIRLGDPVPGALSPLYRHQLLVHGLGFSPDHRTVAVISIGSNSVTFIDTTTNSVSVFHARRQGALGRRPRGGLRVGDRPGSVEGGAPGADSRRARNGVIPAGR